MKPRVSDAEWKRRWMLLNLIRFSGVAVAILGLFIWWRGVLGFQDDLVGMALLFVGATDIFIAPILLARFWRRADDEHLK